MADYEYQQLDAYTKAIRARRDAERQEEIEAARYANAKNNKAGAGRGVQGGATAKEIKDYNNSINSNKPATVFKKGGSISSARRADGIAKRGRTRGQLR